MSVDPILVPPDPVAPSFTSPDPAWARHEDDVVESRLAAAAFATSLLASVSLLSSLWSSEAMGLVCSMSWQLITLVILQAKHSCRGGALLSAGQRAGLAATATLIALTPWSPWLGDRLVVCLVHVAAASAAWFSARMYIRAPRSFGPDERISGAYPIYRASHLKSS